MTPVDMLDIWSPQNPQAIGDCFRACLASILDIPTGMIPHFMQIQEKANWSWAYSLDQWLAPQGLWYCDFPAEINTYSIWVPLNGIYAIATGTSPRNSDWNHSVVVRLGRYHDPEVIHDPHPSRVGLGSDIKLIGMLMSRKAECSPMQATVAQLTRAFDP